MTLLPSSDYGITGWPGEKYEVNEICAHPTCNKPSAHTHHCWSRSHLRKDYEWVKLPDGTVIGNRIGFCVEHHDMLTGEVGGYRARLSWEGGVMWWQIKVVSAPATSGMDLGSSVPIIQWVTVGALTAQPPVPGQSTNPHRHASVDEEAACPTCGHVKRRGDVAHAKLPRRNTKIYAIAVPDDAEIGVEILDSWIDDFAIPLGAEEWTSRLRRYHVLITALAWVKVNEKQFIADVAEAAGRRVA